MGGTVLVVAPAAVAVHLGLVPGGSAITAGGGPQPGMPHPPPGVESSGAPLGTPMVAPSGGGAYDFLQRQADGTTPVAYDPCRPIHYVIRPDNAPYAGGQLIGEAVARISAVTGLVFVDDGETDEDPSDQREPFQPDRYGNRWAPVLITWDTVPEQADLAADVAGLGGSTAVSAGDGPRVYVTGTVDLDAMQFAEILTRPDGSATARAIVLHELGHVLGLAHVSDPAQLMYPQQSTVYDFAAGDLAGLAQLGSGACVPSI